MFFLNLLGSSVKYYSEICYNCSSYFILHQFYTIKSITFIFYILNTIFTRTLFKFKRVHVQTVFLFLFPRTRTYSKTRENVFPSSSTFFFSFCFIISWGCVCVCMLKESQREIYFARTKKKLAIQMHAFVRSFFHLLPWCHIVFIVARRIREVIKEAARQRQRILLANCMCVVW